MVARASVAPGVKTLLAPGGLSDLDDADTDDPSRDIGLLQHKPGSARVMISPGYVGHAPRRSMAPAVGLGGAAAMPSHPIPSEAVVSEVHSAPIIATAAPSRPVSVAASGMGTTADVVMVGNPLRDGSRRPSRRASLSASIRNLASVAWQSLRGMGDPATVSEMAAVDEHAAKAPVFAWSLIPIRRDYGNGPYVYFCFLAWLAVLNFVIGLLLSITYGATFSGVLDTSSFAGAFVALYPSSAFGTWVGTTSAAIVVILGGMLAYPLIHSKALAVTHDDLAVLSADEDRREDLMTRSATSIQRRWRRTATAGGFVATLGIQAAITYGVIVGLASASTSTAGLVLAAVNTALNFVSRIAIKRMTFFELHKRHSTHRDADTVKLFVLKFANVVILYLLKAAVLNEDVTGSDGSALTTTAIVRKTCRLTSLLPDGSSVPCTCPLISSAWTAFWLLVLDTAASSIISPLAAWLRIRALRCVASRAQLSDYDQRPEFEPSTEFVGVLYRQFLTLQGCILFPALPLIASASFFLKVWTDRFKLIKLCRKVLQREEPVKVLVVVLCGVFVTIYAAFGFPQGLVFVSLGIPSANLAPCQFLPLRS